MMSKFQALDDVLVRVWALDKTRKGKSRVAWIENEVIRVYVRLTRRHFVGVPGFMDCLDVANIEVARGWRRQGVFKSLMWALERDCRRRRMALYVENVLEPAIIPALTYWGYTSGELGGVMSFWKLPPKK